MVVTDTSFLFSLFGGDTHSATARAWVRRSKQPIAVTTLGRYEFANAIRFAAFRKMISPADASGSLAAFEADLLDGALQLTPVNWTSVVTEAERLSVLHTLSGGHRSFDILHVATARVLEAKTFLTFDMNQRKLATAARLAVAP